MGMRRVTWRRGSVAPKLESPDGPSASLMSDIDTPEASGNQPSSWLIRLYRPAQFALDLGVIAAAFVGAYLLRFDFALDDTLRRSLAAQTPFVVLVYFAALLLAGAHRRSWRYTGIQDVPVFARAVFYGTAVILAVRLLPIDVLRPLRVPLSIIAMNGVLVSVGVVGAALRERGNRPSRVRRRRSAQAQQCDRRYSRGGKHARLAPLDR